MSDIAAALTASIANDGQTVPVANLPMGGFKHTGVAVAVSGTDYARWDQVLPVAGGNITPGNLGIGATAPAGRLHVNGSVVFGGGNAGPYHVLSLDGSNNLVANAWNGFLLQVGSTTRMSISSAGDIAVGASPAVNTARSLTVTNADTGSSASAAIISASNAGTLTLASLSTAGGARAELTAATANGLRISTGSGTIDFFSGGVNGLTMRADRSLWTDNNARPGFFARAWVNFNGTGTPAIRAGGNFSSITDNGPGDYTVNLSTAMPDTSFAAIASCSDDGSGANIPGVVSIVSQTTGSVRLLVRDSGSGSVDRTTVTCAIFR
jgi:hypothetical protein